MSSPKNQRTAKTEVTNPEVVESIVTPSAAVAAPAKTGVQVVKKIANNLMKNVPVSGRCRVAGHVKKAIGKESAFGPYTEFVGDFAAKIEGVLYKSGKLLLPAVADMELCNTYAAALEQVAEGQTAKIEFVFDLVKNLDTDPKNKNGFQWALEYVNAPAPESDKTLAMLGSTEKPLAITG